WYRLAARMRIGDRAALVEVVPGAGDAVQKPGLARGRAMSGADHPASPALNAGEARAGERLQLLALVPRGDDSEEVGGQLFSALDHRRRQVLEERAAEEARDLEQVGGRYPVGASGGQHHSGLMLSRWI